MVHEAREKVSHPVGGDEDLVVNGSHLLRDDPGGPFFLARDLGADVPVCLTGRPAWMSGWGEQLRPVNLPRLALCLVMPALRVSTAEVFAALDAPPSAETAAAEAPPQTPTDLAGVARLCENDLWPVVRARHPELERLRQDLEEQSPRAVSMSGAGPTLFGLFASMATADAAARALARPGVSTRAVLTLAG